MCKRVFKLKLILQCSFIVYTVSSSYELDTVTEPVIHGEGPHWDAEKKILYFVDFLNQTVNSYDPLKKEVNQVIIVGSGQVSLVVPVQSQNDILVTSRGRDLVAIKWDGKSSMPSETRLLTRVDKDKPGNTMNDGKVDSSGRLWAGTLGPGAPNVKPNEARFYSFESNFQPVVQLSPVSISNGIAWNKENTLMYYIDSLTRKIDVFDFYLTEGKISNRKTLFNLGDYDIPGIPDGMTIDENNNLWVAVFNGSSVLHIDSATGKLINQIKFPVTYVTSCAFGGDDLEHLYVTTSKGFLEGEELTKEPKAGSVFRLSKLGVKGQKQNKLHAFTMPEEEQEVEKESEKENEQFPFFNVFYPPWLPPLRSLYTLG